ncbi:MAG TPA: hypothetical protein VLC92_01195 [Rhodocyclaceae bacterium]|nr:hypothetical protein [Rhodocyclaceae bacterium]
MQRKLRCMNTEPTSLRAGDSTSWTKSLPDYPASAGWVLAYRLVPQAGGTASTIPTVAAGDDHAVILTGEQTAEFFVGDCTLVGAVTKLAERITVVTRSCTVLPDLMAAGVSDPRSTARKIVEAIDAWLSGKAGWAGEKQIADRHIKDHPLPDLILLRDRFARDVASEDARLAILNGLGRSNRVRVSM